MGDIGDWMFDEAMRQEMEGFDEPDDLEEYDEPKQAGLRVIDRIRQIRKRLEQTDE